MSTLLGLTLIAVVITVGIVLLLENDGPDPFGYMLLQIIWIPLACLWGAGLMLSWLR